MFAANAGGAILDRGGRIAATVNMFECIQRQRGQIETTILISFLLSGLLCIIPALALELAQWVALEKVEPCTITAKSGASLYASMGEEARNWAEESGSLRRPISS